MDEGRASLIFNLYKNLTDDSGNYPRAFQMQKCEAYEHQVVSSDPRNFYTKGCFLLSDFGAFSMQGASRSNKGEFQLEVHKLIKQSAPFRFEGGSLIFRRRMHGNCSVKTRLPVNGYLLQSNFCDPTSVGVPQFLTASKRFFLSKRKTSQYCPVFTVFVIKPNV